MSEHKPYIIICGGKKLTVSKSLYLYYYRSERRLKYYEHDIKIETEIRDKNRKIVGYAPSKETSFDQITEGGVEFADDDKNVENSVVGKLMLDKLRDCLPKLDEGERRLINDIYFGNMSERQVSLKTGIHYMTIHSRKQKILAKLKKMVEK